MNKLKFLVFPVLFLSQSVYGTHKDYFKGLIEAKNKEEIRSITEQYPGQVFVTFDANTQKYHYKILGDPSPESEFKLSNNFGNAKALKDAPKFQEKESKYELVSDGLGGC